jgi:hypothetical protein
MPWHDMMQLGRDKNLSFTEKKTNIFAHEAN